MEKSWYLYILECRDGTFYTGITDCLERRIAAHNAGKGAKYTRGRGPVRLRYFESGMTHAEAARREAQVKRLTREQKLALMAQTP